MSADFQFKQLIDRVLRCREAEDAAKDDTKEVYAELKGLGYDKTAAGALVAELRKRDKNPDQFEERSAVLDLYRDAYERAGGSLAHTHTREGSEHAAAKSAADQSVSAVVGGSLTSPDRHEADESPVAKSHSPASSSRQANTAGADAPPSAPAPLTDAEVPAFLRKPAVVLRPHCLNPDLCAGSGRNHCHSCRKAMADTEAAA